MAQRLLTRRQMLLRQVEQNGDRPANQVPNTAAVAVGGAHDIALVDWGFR